MNKFNRLNPDDFRRWINKKEEKPIEAEQFLVGKRADPKFCGKRIARSMVLEDGRAGRVVREFVQNGGVVKSVEGDNYLIEVDSGSFYIHKRNVIV